MSGACDSPVPFEVLIAYHQRELPELEAEQVEAHYFSCAHCSEQLEVLSRFEQGMRAVVHGGQLMVGSTMAMVGHARARGMVVREYRTDPGEHVHCTAGPEDVLLVTRYGGLHGVTSVDVHFRGVIVGTDQVIHMEQADVPVDQATGDLVLIAPGDLNRSFPGLEIEVRLTTRTAGGSAEAGPYHYHHRPWDLLDDEQRRLRAGR